MKIIDQITAKELWTAAEKLVTADAIWIERANILDYHLGPDYDDIVFGSYEFDISPSVRFGASEGIYAYVMLEGILDTTDKSRRYSIGTLKTLGQTKDDYLKMGILSTLMAYHMAQYVGRHLHRFETDERAGVTFYHGEKCGQRPMKHGHVKLTSIVSKAPVLTLYNEEMPLPITPEIMWELVKKALIYYSDSMLPKARARFISLAKEYCPDQKLCLSCINHGWDTTDKVAACNCCENHDFYNPAR